MEVGSYESEECGRVANESRHGLLRKRYLSIKTSGIKTTEQPCTYT